MAYLNSESMRYSLVWPNFCHRIFLTLTLTELRINFDFSFDLFVFSEGSFKSILSIQTRILALVDVVEYFYRDNDTTNFQKFQKEFQSCETTRGRSINSGFGY